MSFDLIQLPYSADALEPHLSRESLELHYGEHYRRWVASARSLSRNTRFESMSLSGLVRSSAPGPLFNAAAEAWNHEFYFRCLDPRGERHPRGDLLRELENSFGSFDAFRRVFESHVLDTFGAGWVWLTRQPSASLGVVALKDAGNPIMLGHQALLACDVWEHAYYLDHRNDRRAYLESFWKLVDWGFVAQRARSVESDLAHADR